jgi:hypothetical protein
VTGRRKLRNEKLHNLYFSLKFYDNPSRTMVILTEVLRNFSQSLQAVVGIVLLLDHYRFLPDPFQYIIHLSSYNLMLYSRVTKSIVT